MKNIKFVLIIMLQVSLLQLVSAQTILDNGREFNAAPANPTETTTASASKNDPPESSSFSDRDVPVPVSQDKPVDYFYPADMDVLSDGNSEEVGKRLNEMARVLEQLRLENQTIRESLRNCCAASDLGLNAHDAYLVQNAPNPFIQSSEIKYFVPENLTNAEIHICETSGKQLRAFEILDKGNGSISIDAASLSNGTYVYALVIDGVIVDSKVMLIVE